MTPGGASKIGLGGGSPSKLRRGGDPSKLGRGAGWAGWATGVHPNWEGVAGVGENGRERDGDLAWEPTRAESVMVGWRGEEERRENEGGHERIHEPRERGVERVGGNDRERDGDLIWEPTSNGGNGDTRSPLLPRRQHQVGV